MKRIVICCDGTWNSPDEQQKGIPCPTNVAKIGDAVKPIADDGVAQSMYYDPGIGTGGTFLQRAYDGATGKGLSHNILEAFRYLISTYQPEDELYSFGFSRGAFTVRSLAGLIRNCGILRRDAGDRVDRAFALYRSRASATHPKEREATLFRRTYAVSDVAPIKFIGVWDTVGALGNPLIVKECLGRRNMFHDTDLSSHVEHAYQALAIDEKRRNFEAALWHQPRQAEHQVLEQVWFVGVHSNIGGGCLHAGLSDIALQWMLSKAGDCGLGLAAVDARPDYLESGEESWKGFYRLRSRFYRPIAAPFPDKGPTYESLHASVMQRYRQDPSYRPVNLEDYFRRFPHLRPSA